MANVRIYEGGELVHCFPQKEYEDEIPYSEVWDLALPANAINEYGLVDESHIIVTCYCGYPQQLDWAKMKVVSELWGDELRVDITYLCSRCGRKLCRRLQTWKEGAMSALEYVEKCKELNMPIPEGFQKH